MIPHIAYSGRFCGDDANGCSEIQCFDGVECIDVQAPGHGAACGPCPTGYIGDGEKCLGTKFEHKHHFCTSFLQILMSVQTIKLTIVVRYASTLLEVSCAVVREAIDWLEKQDSAKVKQTTLKSSTLLFLLYLHIDINECEGANDCQQRCTNLMGSYNCSCQDGFTLNSDGKTCTGMLPETKFILQYKCALNFASTAVVQNPCQDEGGCSHTCAAVNGIAQCFCPAGYTLPRPTDTQCVGKYKNQFFYVPNNKN